MQGMPCIPSSTEGVIPRTYGDMCSDCETWRDQDYKQTRLNNPPHGSANLVTNVAGITASQRANVIDGMISAACSLALSNDALFLGVACLDSYLAAVPITLDLLQPVSIACLWAAAKYDCAVAPRAAVVASLITYCDGSMLSSSASAVQTLVILEASVLKTLDYRLASMPTTKQYKHTILERMGTASSSKLVGHHQIQQLYNMISYLTEVSLLEYQLLPYPRSQLAAAAYTLAHVLLGVPLVCAHLPEMTGYEFPELRICLQYLCALHTTLWQALDNGKPYAVSVKYSSSAVNHVACVAPLIDASDMRLALCSTQQESGE